MGYPGRFGGLLLLIALTAPAASVAAGPEIFLAEEPEIYLAIDKLDGLGHLPGMMTGDRGLETAEVAREAGKAGEVQDPFTSGMLRFLQLEGGTRWDYRFRGGLEASRDGRTPPNAQGMPVLSDGGLRVGGFFRGSAAPWFAVQGRGDVAAGTDGDQLGRVEETSVRLGWPQATLEAGRFSLWWGPGRHGALLFTTNAEPLTGVRLRNSRPIAPGGWLRFLGLIQYDLFAARLESARPIPHSILSGMRVALKPTPWLEIGASRAMHFGGEGHPVTLSTVWDVLTSTNENEFAVVDNQIVALGPGNQIASFDVKVRIPSSRQPVVLYVEGGGEDHSRTAVPSRWAWMGGVFLPSIGPMKRADLRIEFADTLDISAFEPGVWYRHAASNEGYAHRYRGQILGHHMGTDARDLFIEGHYFLLPSSYVELNVDLTQRDFPGPAREKRGRLGAAVVAWLTRNVRGEARAALERVVNEAGAAGANSTDAALQLTLAYQSR